MKLDKKLAIARRNQELGGAVLGVNNCHFATAANNFFMQQLLVNTWVQVSASRGLAVTFIDAGRVYLREK